MRPYIQLRPILETFGYGFVVIVALLVMGASNFWRK